MKKPALNSVAVFCGSSPGKRGIFTTVAKELGQAIADRGLKLVYGGGALGLMGATARAAQSAGGEVLGIIPHQLRMVEGTLSGIDHIFVDDMTERKSRMYSAADAFIILPGGIGTLEEALEILSWQHLHIHNKPIVFLSVDGYWSKLLSEFERIMDEGFASSDFKDILLAAETVEHTFDIIVDRLENPIERVSLEDRISGLNIQ